MTDIVEKVRLNEGLYRNIEFRLRTSYHLAPGMSARPEELSSFDRSTWVVLQPDRLFLKEEDMQSRVDGRKKSIDTLQGFDGQQTRQLEQGEVANIYIGLYEDPRLVRPHTLLLGRAFVKFPLSVWLQGTAAVRAQAGYASSNELISSKFIGEEEVDGLRCFKVAVERKTEGKARVSTRILWLCPERNYLPIKTAAEPVEFGHVEALREIEPGTWFPVHSTLSVYNMGAYLRNNKELRLDNSEQYVVEDIRLRPGHDDAFFRDIPFPKGIPVHVISNGKTIKSYIEGGAAPPPPPDA